MDIKLYTDYLVYILKSAINGTNPDNMPDGINENEFLQFCAFHKLENIVYLTIGDKLSEPAQKKLSERYNRSVFVSATQQYYLEEVENALSENKIDYLVLKGRELVKLYPSEDMRQSAAEKTQKRQKILCLGLVLRYFHTQTQTSMTNTLPIKLQCVRYILFLYRTIIRGRQNVTKFLNVL